MKTRSMVILVILVLFTVLIFQNTHAVVLNLFFWEIQLSMILMLFVIFVAGLITGVIYSNLSRIFRSRPDREHRD